MFFCAKVNAKSQTQPVSNGLREPSPTSGNTYHLGFRLAKVADVVREHRIVVGDLVLLAELDNHREADAGRRVAIDLER